MVQTWRGAAWSLRCNLLATAWRGLLLLTTEHRAVRAHLGRRDLEHHTRRARGLTAQASDDFARDTVAHLHIDMCIDKCIDMDTDMTTCMSIDI